MCKKIMWERLIDQSGMALPIAIMIMVVASLIVVPGLWAVGSMAKVNQELEGSTMGYYAAKAGIEDALWTFKKTGVYEIGDLPDSVNGMIVKRSQEKKLSPPFQIINVTSTATDNVTGETKAIIRVSANITYKQVVITEEMQGTGFWAYEDYPVWHPGSPGTPGVSGYPFEYAIASTDGNVDLRSTAKIISIPVDGEGDIFANGNILNSITSGYVHGVAGATGTINSCNQIQGGCQPGQSPVVFQSIDMTWYWAEACKGLAYSRSGWPAPSPWPDTAMPPPYTGTRTLELSGTSNILGGAGRITYIDGNLRIMTSGTKVTIKGVVWVNGWIQTEGNCSLTTAPDIPGGQCYLIARAPNTSQGAGTYSIIINSNTHINSTGNLNLIADNGGVWLKGNMKDDLGYHAKMGIVYAPDSKIFVEANTYSEFGSIVGKSVELRSNIWIYYNTYLRDNPINGFQVNVTAGDATEGYWTGLEEVPVYHPPGETVPEEQEYWVTGNVEIIKYSGQ